MFILLFAYVFGSAIAVPGVSYREFLIPGIFAQTVVFGATLTGAGLADDMQKGIIDRFRSLPMSRVGGAASGAPQRRAQQRPACSSSCRSPAWSSAGGSAPTSAHARRRLPAAARFRLRVLLGHGAASALIVPTPEVVNNASFIVIFPITFIANTFVPTSTCPACCGRSPTGTRSAPLTGGRATLFGNTGRRRPARRPVVAAAPGPLHRALLVGRDRRLRAPGHRSLPPLDRGLTAQGRHPPRAGCPGPASAGRRHRPQDRPAAVLRPRSSPTGPRSRGRRPAAAPASAGRRSRGRAGSPRAGATARAPG